MNERRSQTHTRDVLLNIGVVVVAAVLALGVTRIGVVTPVEPTYAGLLPAVLTDAPDPVLGTEANQYALTHALVLMAATESGDAGTAAEMAANLRASQMPDGWGMPWEWDAFSDGTVNPETTAYAITTGLVLHALVDARELSQADRRVVDAWRHRLDHYSTAETDDVWVPSSAAMIAAAVARIENGDEPAEIFARLADEEFRWPYSERQLVPNDLQNYVYILWAAEMARDAGVTISWTRNEALKSLERYGEVYPTDVPLTPDMERRANSPWEVSGSGIALAFTARYGSSSDWYERTVTALREARLVPRYAAHALLGIAVREATGPH